MAESTLAISLTELKLVVADYLGMGLTAGSWSADELTRLDMIIKSGLRQFYSPPVVRENEAQHEWSFLRPTGNITTVADDNTYDLPDDFGGLACNTMVFEASAHVKDVMIVSAGYLNRVKAERSATTGRPAIAAIRPVNAMSTATEGQRFDIEFWPTPDDAYVLSYQYFALVDYMTSQAAYPLGGAAHAETIKASCLAAAELHIDNKRDVQYTNFMAHLVSSIDIDRKGFTPRYFGYNGDNSDEQHVSGPSSRRRSGGDFLVTYNGSI